jgi:hypothetical protein
MFLAAKLGRMDHVLPAAFGNRLKASLKPGSMTLLQLLGVWSPSQFSGATTLLAELGGSLRITARAVSRS